MRTNVVIDEELMKEALLLSGLRTKKAVIAQALQEFVKSRKRLDLMKIAGEISFREDYDYKSSRENK